MDGAERTQPALEVSIVHRELLMGEEEQKFAEATALPTHFCLHGCLEEHSYLLTPQNKGSGLISKKQKQAQGRKSK